MIMNMTRAEIIKSKIENINEKYNMQFSASIVEHKNYDSVLVFKDTFTLKDVVTVLHNCGLDEWKVTLNYGDEGGDYLGYTYLDEISRKNGFLKLDGDSEEYEDGAMTGRSLRDSYLMHMNDNEVVHIQNMDEGGDYGTNRSMSYIQIVVNKIGSRDRVNLG